MSYKELLESFYVFQTPMGAMCVEIKEGRIRSLDFTDRPLGGDETDLSRRVAYEMNRYFKGEQRTFDLPLLVEATPFQQAVYRACSDILYGEVCYYSDIARMISRPKAARAVGGALNKNRHMILIPCHRVISKADGGGYRHGRDKKRQLLQLEGGGC